MILLRSQILELREIDPIKTTHEARIEDSNLMNDQELAVLSITLSHVIGDIVEHSEKLVKEYAR
jgi:hypothetical protein